MTRLAGSRTSWSPFTRLRKRRYSIYESAATGLRSTRFALRIRLHSTFNTITLNMIKATMYALPRDLVTVKALV